jgi:hypothetical protein
MEKKPDIKGRHPLLTSDTRKLTYVLNLLFGGAMFVTGGYLIYVGFDDVYPDLLFIILGFLCLVTGFCFIYTNDPIDRLEIYKDRLEVRSFFGRLKRTIYKSEITNWMEEEKQAKTRSWKKLLLFTGKKKYCIPEALHKNYYSIKKELTRGIKRDPEFETSIQNKEMKQMGWIALAIGIFFYGLCYHYRCKEREIKARDLITVKQVIASPIKIYTGRGRTSGLLKLKDYPDFDFEIDKSAYKALTTETLPAKVRTNDTIFIDIPDNDYQMKLTKEKELGFFDKTINYREIPVYGLRDKNTTYLTLDGYNESNCSSINSDNTLYGVIATIAIGLGLYFLGASKKLKD